MARKVARRGGARKTARKTVRKAASKSSARKATRRAAPRRVRSEDRNTQQVAKLEAPAAQKQGDCLSKLFIIALPFIVVGIYLMLRRT